MTEIFSFTPDKVVAVGDGYDVELTFKSLDKGKARYNPDSISPKLEVRKADGAWQIALSYKDTKNSQSTHSFK